MIVSGQHDPALPSNGAAESDSSSPWVPTDASSIDLTSSRLTLSPDDVSSWTSTVVDYDVIPSTTTSPFLTSSSSSNTASSSSFFLWLPYLIFTILLLGLIIVSFLRFHCQRGHQYRRRQEELNDKLQTAGHDTLHLLQPSDPMGTTTTATATTTATGSHPNGVPQHMNLFLQYSQVQQDSYDEEGVSGGRGRRGLGQTTSNSNHLNQQTISRGHGATRRPLVFTFNVNGSMVDIRCEEEERTNTFRLKAEAAGKTTCQRDLMEESDLGNGGHSFVGKRNYCKNRYNRKHLNSNYSSSSTGSRPGAHAHRSVSYAIPEGRTSLEERRNSSEDEALLLSDYKHP